jgi:hypothetical protein
LDLAMSRYGIASAISGTLGLIAFAVGGRVLPGVAMVVFAFALGAAITCAIIAAVRGSRWWSLLCILWIAVIGMVAASVFGE